VNTSTKTRSHPEGVNKSGKIKPSRHLHQNKSTVSERENKDETSSPRGSFSRRPNQLIQTQLISSKPAHQEGAGHSSANRDHQKGAFHDEVNQLTKRELRE
jgi:hypothetical protein